MRSCNSQGMLSLLGLASGSDAFRSFSDNAASINSILELAKHFPKSDLDGG